MSLGSVPAKNSASLEVELAYRFGNLCLDDDISAADAIVRERSGVTVPLDLYSRTFILPVNQRWQDVVYREPLFGLRVVCSDKELNKERVLSDRFPPAFSKRLIRLIQEGRRSEVGYNCLDTGRELSGAFREMLNSFDETDWNFYRKNECDFQPGDLIALRDRYKRIIHVACCLGIGLANEQLYISMWGDYGGLYISDLRAMLHEYSTAKFVEVGVQQSSTLQFFGYFDDLRWHYSSYVDREHFNRSKFAKRCASPDLIEMIRKTFESQNSFTLYFFNVHVFALKKLAEKVFLSLDVTLRPQVKVIDTIADQYEISYPSKSPKTIILANYLLSSVTGDLTRFIGHIQKCLEKDIEDHTIPHYRVAWKFNVSHYSSPFKQKALDYLREKGFSVGLERFYARVTGSEIQIRQNIWLRFPLQGKPSESAKKAIRSLLAFRAIKEKKATKKAEDLIPKILADLETALCQNSAIRQCKFDVYKLAQKEQEKLMKFLQARGFIAFLDPTPYRQEENFKMTSKQDLVIVL